MENITKGKMMMLEVIGIIVTIISVIVTLIDIWLSLYQKIHKNKHQKSNRPTK